MSPASGCESRRGAGEGLQRLAAFVSQTQQLSVINRDGGRSADGRASSFVWPNGESEGEAEAVHVERLAAG